MESERGSGNADGTTVVVRHRLTIRGQRAPHPRPCAALPSSTLLRIGSDGLYPRPRPGRTPRHFLPLPRGSPPRLATLVPIRWTAARPPRCAVPGSTRPLSAPRLNASRGFCSPVWDRGPPISPWRTWTRPREGRSEVGSCRGSSSLFRCEESSGSASRDASRRIAAAPGPIFLGDAARYRPKPSAPRAKHRAAGSRTDRRSSSPR